MKTKQNYKAVRAKWRMYAIGLWGALSLIYLSGEPVDGASVGSFIAGKLAGLASLGLCLIVGRVLYRAGMFPKLKNEEDCKL